MKNNVFFIIACILLFGGFMIVRELKKGGPEIQPEMKQTNSISASALPDFHKWREFDSETGHFRVLLPTIPQHANDKILDSKTGEMRRYDTFVAAGDNGQAFMIHMTTYPNKVEEDKIEEILKATVDDMLKRNTDNKLISTELSKFRGAKALNFSITNGKIYVRGKAFFLGDTLYILSLLTENQSANPPELDFFINSFVADLSKIGAS